MTQGLRDAGLDVVHGAFPGCKVVRGTIRIEEGDERDGDCPWQTTWPEVLREHGPQVVFLESAAFELFDVQAPGSSDWLVPGTPEWASYWYSEMQQAIDTLSSTGVFVVVANIACSNPPVGTSDSVAARSAFNLARVKAGNAVLENLASRNTERMRLVDLNAFPCPDGDYRPGLHGVDPVRDDGVHLTQEGSALVGRWLVPQLLAPEATASDLGSAVTNTP